MPNPTITRVGNIPDFPWEIPNERTKYYAEADPSNYHADVVGEQRYGGPRQILGACLHTPEERADDTETTPWYFQQANAGGSTDFYADNDGDLYQMVSLEDFSWAQGTRTWEQVKPVPAYLPSHSYNRHYVSIEIEGFAASIGRTFIPGGPQWDLVVEWCARMAWHFDFPPTRDRIVGHQELVIHKQDPGAGFPWSELIPAVQKRVRALETGDVPATSGSVPYHVHTFPSGITSSISQ